MKILNPKREIQNNIKNINTKVLDIYTLEFEDYLAFRDLSFVLTVGRRCVSL